MSDKLRYIEKITSDDELKSQWTTTQPLTQTLPCIHAVAVLLLLLRIYITLIVVTINNDDSIRNELSHGGRYYDNKKRERWLKKFTCLRVTSTSPKSLG